MFDKLYRNENYELEDTKFKQCTLRNTYLIIQISMNGILRGQ